MARTAPRFKSSEWLILIGSSVFILLLGVSAFWESSIRWLHFFQAWMYIAAIVGAFHRSRWGFFIGISVAGLWIYANLFATTFFFNGLEQTFTLDSYGTVAADGFAHRRAGVVRQSAGRRGMSPGVLPAASATSPRRCRIRADLHPHHRISCPGHGAVPASLLRSVSANASPPSALAARRTLDRGFLRINTDNL